MPAVSNTSPISNLACIGRLNLLHEQFSELWIPPAVDSELRDLPNSIARKLISDAKRAGLIQRWPDIANTKLVSLLMLELHRGEAEAIALPLETKADHLLIDERDGRLMARQLGLSNWRVGCIAPREKNETNQSNQARNRRAQEQSAFFHCSRCRKRHPQKSQRVGPAVTPAPPRLVLPINSL